MDSTAKDVAKKAVLEFISFATGGPYPYMGKTLKEIHTDMHILDSEFDAFTMDFEEALAKEDIPFEVIAEAMGLVNAVRTEIINL